MFAFDPAPKFTTTVEVKTIGTDSVTESFSATFKVLPIDEFDGFDITTTTGSTDFLNDVFLNAEDITDLDKKPLIFDEGLKRQMIMMPHVRASLIRTYLDDVNSAIRGN